MNERLTVFIGGRKFSALLVGIVFLLVVPLVIQFILIAASEGSGEEKVKELIRDQENIALILIGAGTFLSGRRIILNWLDNLVNPDVKLTESVNKNCEINGFYLILLGSFMEILDQMILHIEQLVDIGVILELTFNFPLDLLSTYILIRLFLNLVSGENKEPEVSS